MTDETKEVANYDEMLAKLATAAKAVEKPTTSNVGCRAGILTYNGTPVGEDNKLDCIVLASTHSNLYYAEKFDADDPKNPVCYAYSEDGENMAPHPKSQYPQAENCDVCPHNKWNSDPGGGKGKACKNGRRLALIPSGTTLEDIPTVEIATFQIPVTSVKNWGTYVNKLATLFNRPPLAMITTISTKQDLQTQFKVLFNNGPNVANEMIMPLIQKVDAAREVIERVYEHNVEPTEEELAEKAEKDAKKASRGKKF